MKNYLKALLLNLAVVTATQASATGAGSSGGGDLFYNKFIRAIPMTRTALQKTRPEWMTETLPEVQQFFKDHQKELIEELAASPMDLRTENANGKCAETGFTSKATIYISKTQCGDVEKFTEEMAREILLGEITHHFNKDNKFSALTAVAIMDAYRGSSKYTLPFVTLVGQFVGSYDEAGRADALQRVKLLAKGWAEQVKNDFGTAVESVKCDEPRLKRYTMTHLPKYNEGVIWVYGAENALRDSLSNVGFEGIIYCSAVGVSKSSLVKVTQELRSTKVDFTAKNPADFIKSYYAAIQDIVTVCDQWKKEAAIRYGERVAHLDCVRATEQIIPEGKRWAANDSIIALANATAYLWPEKSLQE